MRKQLLIGVVALAVLFSQSLLADDGSPRWLKGNLHTHSLWSDGNDFPEMICDWYKSHGYHFLALSDHNILSKGEKWMDVEAITKRGAIGGVERYREKFGNGVETREEKGKQQVRLKPLDEFRKLFEEPERFALLQGEEITDSFQSHPIHLNATNLVELIRPQGGKSLRETIANNLIAVEQQSRRIGEPILAHLNHPNYGFAVTAEDMAAVLEEKFFEVYNGHPGVHHQGDKQHVSMERMWDIANTIRVADMKQPPLFGLATDDSHNYFGERGASPGRGWVQVRTNQLNGRSLITAMMAGDFYSSSGVELRDVRYDANAATLTLDIVPRDGETYVTEFVGTPQNYDRESKPVVDDKGKEIAATRTYSADVGKVLAKVEGTKPSYKLTGEELFVRAVVTSSAKPENPAFDGQRQQAWTQPIGWQKRLASPEK